MSSIRGKYSEKQKKATDKFVAENYDRIEIKVRKGKKAKIASLAESQGMSVTAFIESLIDQEAERLGADLSVPPTPSQQRKSEQQEQ